jgi:hypothetical protein
MGTSQIASGRETTVGQPPTRASRWRQERGDHVPLAPPQGRPDTDERDQRHRRPTAPARRPPPPHRSRPSRGDAPGGGPQSTKSRSRPAFRRHARSGRAPSVSRDDLLTLASSASMEAWTSSSVTTAGRPEQTRDQRRPQLPLVEAKQAFVPAFRARQEPGGVELGCPRYEKCGLGAPRCRVWLTCGIDGSAAGVSFPKGCRSTPSSSAHGRRDRQRVRLGVDGAAAELARFLAD